MAPALFFGALAGHADQQDRALQETELQQRSSDAAGRENRVKQHVEPWRQPPHHAKEHVANHLQ